MPTLYLILAHLLADFTLQPSSLIRWKKKSWKGVAIHVVIFFLLTILFFIPYLQVPQTWLILLLLAFSHFVLDQGKITLQKHTRYKEPLKNVVSSRNLHSSAAKRSRKYVFQRFLKSWLFFIDQGLHILFILMAGNYIGNLEISWDDNFFLTEIYRNTRLIIYISILIFLSYTYDIILFLLKNGFDTNKTYKPDYKGMKKRIFTFIVIYVMFILYLIFIE